MNASPDKQGTYVLTAAYADAGGSVVLLTDAKELILPPVTIETEDVDVVNETERNEDDFGNILNKSFCVMKAIDLEGIKSIVYNYSSENIAAALEVYTDSQELQSPAP